jgi:hypothetical protein
LYATLRLGSKKKIFQFDPETGQFDLVQVPSYDPLNEQFYVNPETGQFGPGEIFLATGPETKQPYFSSKTKQSGSREIPFRRDPETGTVYREFNEEKDGKSETFVEQKCPDGTTLRWKKMWFTSLVFHLELD